MSNQLRARLLLAGGMLFLLLVLSLFVGFGRALEIVGELLGVKPAERRREDKLPPPHTDQPQNTAPAGPGEYLFCFWNVENFFDDKDDGRTGQGDPEYDKWFSADPEALEKKLANLCDVIVALNGGRGPDILALCEVESQRAAELLRDALNKRLKEADRYTSAVLVGEPPSRTRHISPVLISRLPVTYEEKQRWTQSKRLLRATVRAGGHDLTVIVSHWTSRLSDKKGTSRANYAKVIYAQYEAAFGEDPAVDFLVCGDFNDDSTDPSVTEHLHAIGDPDRVKGSKDPPLLFDLFAKARADGQATLYDGSRAHVFDHICVSPGLLDGTGWACEPDTAAIVTSFADRRGHPHRFGGPNDKPPLSARGCSDHFPVTVRLRVR